MGIVNKKNFRTEYIESLLFNVVSSNNKVKRGLDFLYENATPYGMFYFGIHTKKRKNGIKADILFDLLLQIVMETNEDFIEKISRDITKRLQVLDLDDRQKCIELAARILQRFRRNQDLDKSIILPESHVSFDGHHLKGELLDFIEVFKGDADNKEILFCYQ